MTTEQKTLSEFYSLCMSHDWFYSFSDDHSVWKCGQDAQVVINRIRKQGDEFEALYQEFVNYREKDGPVPTRPE